jgi:DNA polymerase-1
MKKKLYLIDGMSIAFRAYFAMSQNNFTNKSGEPTGAIFGFVNIITSLLDKLAPKNIAVCFDCREKTFRRKLYANYKANRAEFPEELGVQLPYIKQFLDLIGIDRIELAGYEADDIIGTFSRIASENDVEVFCYTTDKDFYQLLNSNVNIIRNTREKGKEDFEIIRIGDVKEKFGVNTDEVVDYLALIGDVADNVPGIKGVGKKTAIPLIEKYKNIENIYANIDEIEKPRLKKLLENGKENAFLSKKLVTIDRNVPLDVSYEALNRKNVNYVELDALFSHLGLRQQREKWKVFQLKDINNEQQNINSRQLDVVEENKDVETHNYSSLQNKNCVVKCEKIDAKNIKYLLDKLNLTDEVAIYIEINTKDKNKIINSGQLPVVKGISFCNSDTESYYLPLIERNDDLFNEIDYSTTGNIPSATDCSPLLELKDYLESENVLKVGYNIKNIAFILKRYGINLAKIASGSHLNFFDIAIAGYLLNTNDNLSLNNLAEKYLSLDISNNNNDMLEDVSIIWRLYKVLKNKLAENNLDKLAYNIEFPLINVLNDMEYTGIAINKGKLAEQSVVIGSEIDKKRQEIYEETGVEFNIDSPKQLIDVLTNKMGINLGKKPSTDMQTLTEISNNYPIATTILDYRHLTKLKNTYIDALPKLINPYTNRIHTTFNQISVNTGRLSSTDPNLQNIPIRTNVGKEIRAAFITDKVNHLLLSADYSQIELRIMAYLSGDKNMINAINNDMDIHSATASAIYNYPVEQIDDEMRRTAKTINFGIIYGLGLFGLAQRLNISRSTASAIIKDYFNKFSGIKAYIYASLEKVRKLGYTETIIGRKRYFPDINNNNHNIRATSERAAINMPIQGSASDMIKIAMLNIFNEFNKKRFQSKMLLQVHDELLFEVPLSEMDEVKKIVKNKMETALSLGNVPLKISIGVGNNWLEAH